MADVEALFAVVIVVSNWGWVESKEKESGYESLESKEREIAILKTHSVFVSVILDFVRDFWPSHCTFDLGSIFGST